MPPPQYEPLLPVSVVVSVFHHSLPSSPFFLFFLFLLLFLGCLDLAAPPPPLDSVSVSLGPGTIRKAQNLLKQYSQHGLDGKKGGSNLTPLEGNAPRSPLRCLLSLLAYSVPVMLCFHVSHSEQQAHIHLLTDVTTALRSCRCLIKVKNVSNKS